MTNDFNVFDNKIIILYILDHSTMPLSIDQIVKFCEDFDDITYFDICSYIDSLKKNNYIDELLEEGVMTYTLTPLGKSTLNELLELIPGVDLHNLKKLVNKNMNEIKKDYSIDTTIFPIKEDEFKVSCSIKEGNDALVNISIYAGTKEQAKNISKIWDKNAETIYNKLLDMLTKE